MTRNLWGWDQRSRWNPDADQMDRDTRAAQRLALDRAELLLQGRQQGKDWRFGLLEQPRHASDLKPEERAEGATCQCPWCLP